MGASQSFAPLMGVGLSSLQPFVVAADEAGSDQPTKGPKIQRPFDYVNTPAQPCFAFLTLHVSHASSVDADTEEILGAAILGLNGDEAVHCLLDVMYAKKPYTVISRAVHIHPTVSELIPTVLQELAPL